jgi:hypothetical protein
MKPTLLHGKGPSRGHGKLDVVGLTAHLAKRAERRVSRRRAQGLMAKIDRLRGLGSTKGVRRVKSS